MRFFKRPESPIERRGYGRDVATFLVVITLAVLLAWLVIAFVFESYQVSGPSMQNTLHNNDRLIVWKVPRTWASITGHAYIPNRGDIIIFKENGLATYGEGNVKQLVKRVVGLPGDHLVIKNDKVTIYNQEHPHGFTVGDNFDGKNGNPDTSGDIDITLKKDQIFVMGDNRGNSLDSRIFGPINASQIVGKLVFRDWPLGDMKVF